MWLALCTIQADSQSSLRSSWCSRWVRWPVLTGDVVAGDVLAGDRVAGGLAATMLLGAFMAVGAPSRAVRSCLVTAQHTPSPRHAPSPTGHMLRRGRRRPDGRSR